MADLPKLRRDVTAMSGALFDALGVPFEQATELERQVLAAFAFGMASTAGWMAKATQPEVHALALACLVDVFHYNPPQAAAFSQQLIDAAADPTVHDTLNAIIHRGIDGHRQWLQGNLADLAVNLKGVLRGLGAAGE